MKKLKDYIDKATSNVNEDRAATKTLLMTLMKYIQTGTDRHKEAGLIAAKYLETLQRSNEQLVKIAALVAKKESGNVGLSEEDKDELFDIINESKDVEEE
jgi:hypothetical protein